MTYPGGLGVVREVGSVPPLSLPHVVDLDKVHAAALVVLAAHEDDLGAAGSLDDAAAAKVAGSGATRHRTPLARL